MRIASILFVALICSCGQKNKVIPKTTNDYKVSIFGKDPDAAGTSNPIAEIRIQEINDSCAYAKGYSEFLLNKKATESVSSSMDDSHLKVPGYFVVYNNDGSDVSNYLKSDIRKSIEEKINSLIK